MGDSVESLAEVEVDNHHGSPLIYPASHVIVESYQIGQAWFPLGESMLTTPDFIPVWDDFEDRSHQRRTQKTCSAYRSNKTYFYVKGKSSCFFWTCVNTKPVLLATWLGSH